MINDINGQMLFTTLDIIQNKISMKCRKETAEQLKELLVHTRRIRIEFSNLLNKIWNNYDLIVTQIPGRGDLILAGSQSINPTVEEREKFEAILSSYTVGIRSVENTIFEGAYIQACCLIRQEIEALTQMNHLLQGTMKEKRTPNIAVLDMHYKRIYSDLTGISHLSNHQDISHMAKGNDYSDDFLISPLQFSFVASFNQPVSKILFAIHYAILIEVQFCLSEYFNKHIPSIDKSVESKNKLEKSYDELSELVPELELPKKLLTAS